MSSHPDFGSLRVATRHHADGTIYIDSTETLGPYPERLTERLHHWATVAPDRRYLAQRGDDGKWRTLTYGETFDKVQRIASRLLEYGLSKERPLILLSGNDLEHALLALAALELGIAFAPISPAYSLISTDFANLKHIFKLLTPGLVFASDGAKFQRAIDAVVPADMPLVVTSNPPAGRPCTTIDEMLRSSISPEVAHAHADVNGDTIAKILFTSGSTGMPKGVINTQRMLCSNQRMMQHTFAFLAKEPPVMLDWLPWHHTAGGNATFNEVLYNGGTLYIDGGKPTPADIKITIDNLREISPTMFVSVPIALQTLVVHFRNDEQLRKSFFRNLKLLQYAAASLPPVVWEELEQLAKTVRNEPLVLLTGFGSTESAPFALSGLPSMPGAGVIGLPAPGLQLKLAPMEGKYEARIKGPSITPGYWRDPEATKKAFDEEGYYRFGDAMRLVDPDDVTKGLLFDGRVTENFKLSTGTWVHVGALRAAFIDHFMPFVQDVVVAGADRQSVRVLVFPAAQAIRAKYGIDAAVPLPDVLKHPQFVSDFRERIQSFAKKATGSSNRVTCVTLLLAPPSMDRGEVTDKGSINQRAVLKHRHAAVEAMYAVDSDKVDDTVAYH